MRDWLPKQRWFAGKDRGTKAVQFATERLLLEGDPSLLHLFVEVEQNPAVDPIPGLEPAADNLTTTYQLLLGVRSSMPPELEHAIIGHVDDMGWVYEASQDHALMHSMLGWVAGEETRDGIVFALEPGAKLDPDAVSLVLGGEQSNTSVVFGEQTIMKLFRIVVPGLNPDLEVTRALTEMGNLHVPALQGWIESDVDGVASTLGLLQEFLRSGTDGWALALTSVRDLFAEADLHAGEVGGDFAAESERLGMATADVHSSMAQALPTAIADQHALERWPSRCEIDLRQRNIAVPALADHAAAISAVFDALANSSDPVPCSECTATSISAR